MANTWRIEAVEVNTADTSKATAHWRIIGEDGNTITNSLGETVPNTATVYGTQVIDTLVKAGVNDEDVILAVQLAMGEAHVAELEAAVDAQLELNLNPPVVTFKFEDGAAVAY
jgi:hypothetical protein